MLIKFRINHIVFRYENVPATIVSKNFNCSVIPSRGIVLSRDFSWKRSVSSDELECTLERIAKSAFGDEIKRSASCGLRPIVHIDYSHRTSWMFFFSFTLRHIRRLACRGGNFLIVVRFNDADYAIEVTHKSLMLLKNMGCSLEIA